MHIYYDAKDMLHKELENIVKKGEINNSNLEVIDILLNSIKNIYKIIMYDEYSDGGYSYGDGYSYADNYSNARGRRGNVKRDSQGRYAREGYSRDGYARRDGYSNGYSYADGEKEERLQMLRDMMNNAQSEQERNMFRNLISQLQNS